MQDNSVSNVLRALAVGKEARSETARLRDVIDEVEAAISAGVTRQAILDALHEQGFKMTLRGFESALYRIRKKSSNQERVTPTVAPLLIPKQEDTSRATEAATSTPDTKKALRERRSQQFIKEIPSNSILKNLKG